MSVQGARRARLDPRVEPGGDEGREGALHSLSSWPGLTRPSSGAFRGRGGFLRESAGKSPSGWEEAPQDGSRLSPGQRRCIGRHCRHPHSFATPAKAGVHPDERAKRAEGASGPPGRARGDEGRERGHDFSLRRGDIAGPRVRPEDDEGRERGARLLLAWWRDLCRPSAPHSPSSWPGLTRPSSGAFRGRGGFLRESVGKSPSGWEEAPQDGSRLSPGQRRCVGRHCRHTHSFATPAKAGVHPDERAARAEGTSGPPGRARG